MRVMADSGRKWHYFKGCLCNFYTVFKEILHKGIVKKRCNIKSYAKYCINMQKQCFLGVFRVRGTLKYGSRGTLKNGGAKFLQGCIRLYQRGGSLMLYTAFR